MEQKPLEKGWRLVKDTLGNDEQYLALKQGFPITLTGSNQIQFILYPNGEFVKVGKNSPKIGKLRIHKDFVAPDYLATIIAWIIYDADRLVKNWGCGNFELETPYNPEMTEAWQQIRSRAGSWERRSHRSLWDLSATTVFIVVMFGVGLIIMPMMMDQLTELAPAQASNTTLAANSTESNISTLFTALALSPISGFVILALFSISALALLSYLRNL